MASPQVDTRWFRDQLADQKKNQRQLAKALKRHPSAITLLLQGKRRMTAQDCAAIAQFLGAPTTEVMRRAGIETGLSNNESIQVTAIVNAAGEITPGRGARLPRVSRPPDTSADVIAARIQSEGALDGFIVYYRPSVSVAPEAIGRLAVVKVRGEGLPILCVLRPGYSAGKFNCQRWAEKSGELIMENVRIQSSVPVLWLRGAL